MLTDRILKTSKPKDKGYKIQDRDGMYAYVAPSGTISFRFDYKFHGKRMTLTIGKYGIISLADARERLIAAKKMLADGVNPAQEKRERKIIKMHEGETLETWFLKYVDQADFADSTRKLREDIFRRHIPQTLARRGLSEISEQEIRKLCDKIKDGGAPSQAVFVRDIFARTYQYAILKGLKINNPAANIAPASIARFKPRERSLTEKEIKVFLEYLKKAEVYPASKKSLLLILLTLTRKSEAVEARWAEIDFDKAVWQIPAERMKARRAHNVYLSRQAIELLQYMHTLAEGSPFVFPARGKPDIPMAVSSANRAIKKTLELAAKDGITIADFTVHDLRRTASTLLHEQGYNSDWIEKALAHEQQGVRAVYNKAEYADQRRQMLQEWADFVFGL